MTRLTSGPAVKLNPRNFRSCGRATALFAMKGVEDLNIRGFCVQGIVGVGATIRISIA
jgi:hypothetical protein